MTERDLFEMSATVLVESQLFQVLTSDLVAINADLIREGDHRYTFEEALAAICELDDRLRSCSRYVYKRIRALRGSFANAFGPDMYEIVGIPPACKE